MDAPTEQFGTNRPSVPAWDDFSIKLDELGGAFAVCTLDGNILNASKSAWWLFSRLSRSVQSSFFSIPPALWRELSVTPLGESIEWQPPDNDGSTIGCTRYRLGDRHLLLVMRELSSRHGDLSKRLHEQRLEVIGRLVATIAHDLRTPLASIIYNTNFVTSQLARRSSEDVSESLEAVRVACDRMKTSIDGFLDFARLGLPSTANVPLKEVCDRVLALLRPTFREGRHVVKVSFPADGAWVQANPLILEQTLVNLVLNAVESAPRSVGVDISGGPTDEFILPDRRPAVWVRVRDTGDGIPVEIQGKVFDPFFSTKPRAIGLGLTMAREAVAEMAGLIDCRSCAAGTTVTVYLPAGTQPPER